MKPTPDLNGIVNASGFILQIALKNAVEESRGRHQFDIEAIEHPWKAGDQIGFIDLILGRGTMRVVCECKRSRDANWVFAVERGALDGSRARLHWTRFDKTRLFDGWFDFVLTRAAPESQFCMIRGGGENDSPLLERIASQLVTSIESLAAEETSLRLIGDTRDAHRVYIPVIVTTARLWLYRFATRDIEIATGEVTNAEYEEVQSILFRKALTAPSEPEPGGDVDEMPHRAFRRQSREQERTVLIVNAVSFVAQLDAWSEGIVERNSPLPSDWQ